MGELLEKERNIFWSSFLAKSKNESLIIGFSPTDSMKCKHYLSVPVGGNSYMNGVYFTFAAFKDYHIVELTIQEEKDDSTRLFERLLAKKKEIEEGYGESLFWDGPRVGRKRCKIMSQKYLYGHKDLDKVDIVHASLMEKMNNFTKAIRRHIS